MDKVVKDNPESEELKEIQKALIETIFYTNNLQTNFANCKIANSDYREQRNDALLELNELKEDTYEL